MASQVDTTSSRASGAPHAEPQPRADPRAVFGRTMGLVAVTCGAAALGTYVAGELPALPTIVPWLAAFVSLVALEIAAELGRRGVAVALLLTAGLLLGVATSATVLGFAESAPSTVLQAACATALTVAGLGAFGYATRRDLAHLGRALFLALVGLVVAGIALVVVAIPAAETVWALAGVGIFSGYALIDFNRLRRAGQDAAVVLAAGIFVDILNLFLFFLDLFDPGE